jgi:hypothetical protein
MKTPERVEAGKKGKTIDNLSSPRSPALLGEVPNFHYKI